MDELLKIPNCMGDKIPQLQAVYDKIGVNVCGVEALGIRSEQYGSFLIPIIMSKLPDGVHLQIARVITEDVWDVNELLHVIKGKVEARELSDTVTVHDLRDQEAPTRRTVFPPTATSLVTGDLPHKIQCVFCRANHYSAACDINYLPVTTGCFAKGWALFPLSISWTPCQPVFNVQKMPLM